MKKLSTIQKIILPTSHISHVYEHLRQCGQQGVEGVGLWFGEFQTDVEFLIKSTIIPSQKAYEFEDGLLYTVGEEELERINLWQYENKQTLIAQIHSHPNEAYHSATDDAYPIVTKLGGISIVVPDFAFRAFKIEDWAVYRLSGSGWD